MSSCRRASSQWPWWWEQCRNRAAWLRQSDASAATVWRCRWSWPCQQSPTQWPNLSESRPWPPTRWFGTFVYSCPFWTASWTSLLSAGACSRSVRLSIWIHLRWMRAHKQPHSHLNKTADNVRRLLAFDRSMSPWTTSNRAEQTQPAIPCGSNHWSSDSLQITFLLFVCFKIFSSITKIKF